MLESRFAAQRMRPPVPDTVVPNASRRVTIRVLAPMARFSLRLRMAESIGAVGTFRFDQGINHMAAAGDRWSARLGPDEWLVGGAEADADLIQNELETFLSNVTHSLVDVSHRNVAFEIGGPDAAAALSAGCPLDLDDAVFPAGSATRTLLGKAEIVLMRPSRETIYRVEGWRSFATYLHGFLIEATHGLG